MMKKYAGPLLLVLFLLLLLEGVSRFILSRIYNRQFESALIEDNKYFNSSGLKANARGKVWGKPFHTDQFGCRTGPKPFSARKKKWLFIGDSVTEGVGVDDSCTFASLVALRLDTINVMNYSLIGYSDADYLNVLNTLLSAGDSGISKVTIFFCLNDVYGPAKTSQLPVMAKSNWMGWLNGYMQNSYATYKLVKLFVYRHSDSYFRYDEQFYKTGNPFFEAAMVRLKSCDSVCHAAGVEMNVVILPYSSQICASMPRAGDFTPQLMVKSFCNKEHIVFGDLSAFTGEGNWQDLYLFADEIHFSEEGHKKVADYILSH